MEKPAGSGGKRKIERRTDERTRWRHVNEARAAARCEHQLAEYVAGLEIEECARILTSDPSGLTHLATLRDECRVGPGEERSFEEVIRTWTGAVLSGTESG